MERIAVRFPALFRFLIRLLLRLPPSPLRRAGLRYLSRRGYAAWNRRDWELNTIAHDRERCELEWSGIELVPVGARSSYRGIEGYLEFADEWLEAFPDSHFELESIRDRGGNRHIQVLRQTGHGLGSGAVFDAVMEFEFEFDRGWLIRQTQLSREDTSLRARGRVPRSS